VLEKTSEKLLEKKLKTEISRLGGLCIKLTSPYFTGMPDRIILMPGGRSYFAELKSSGGRLSSRQKLVHELLGELGHFVVVIDSRKDLNDFIKNLPR